MRVRRFEWRGAQPTATAVRSWTGETNAPIDVTEIYDRVVREGDAAVVELTNRFDSTERPIAELRVDPELVSSAPLGLDASLRDSLELAIANVREVASAQLVQPSRTVLGQGQVVTVSEVPVALAGIYAPGGRAAYPTSVIMCAIPAAVAGVERVVLATPPGANGEVPPLVLAAAALCGVEEVYAMGGAQAIFALAQGTESVPSVDVIAGPGSDWVREAKKLISGEKRIDSLAGPSELMVIAGHDADPEWIALDLCAQAEHGEQSPLLVAAVEEHVLDAVADAAQEAAGSRPSVADAALALVQVPDAEAAVDLANEFSPEHLQLMEEDAALLGGRVRTAGCVFVGRHAATAFGDYVAGSNHVLPTGRAGRFSGPLGPGTFTRRISTVEVPPGAASKLAPHVDAIARAEGFPVHGESAMIRSEGS